MLYYVIYAIYRVYGEDVMADLEFIGPKKTARISFSIEPAYNALCSFCLLNEDLGGFSEWVTQTAAGLSEEQKKECKHLCGAVTHLNGVSWPGFPEWLDDLSGRSPQELVKRELELVLLKAKVYLGETEGIPAPDQLLSDRNIYFNLHQRICDSTGCEFDRHREIYEKEYDNLINPEVYKEKIVSHFGMLWDRYLAKEWKRILPMLRDSVAAFESIDYSGKPTNEALLQIIDREEIPSKWANWFSTAEEIIVIPSAHIGPYLLMFDDSEKIVRIAGRARIPEGAGVRSTALDRSELLMRINALSDDTRLRILELIAQGGELSTQDIMDKTDLSQSSASRHLSQLTATGYLVAHHNDRVKRFRLRQDRLDDTFNALKDILK